MQRPLPGMASNRPGCGELPDIGVCRRISVTGVAVARRLAPRMDAAASHGVWRSRLVERTFGVDEAQHRQRGFLNGEVYGRYDSHHAR